MSQPNTISPEKVKFLFSRQFNVKESELQLTPAGTGRFSITYFVKIAGDAHEYVIRIAPPDDLLQLFYEYRMMRQEPELHRLIQDATAIPIPTILKSDFSRELIDRDYLIMNRMPGRTLAEMRDSLSKIQFEQALREWGKWVAQLHTITNEKYGYIGGHHPMEPQNHWDAAFEIMWSKMLDDCLNCGIYQESDRILGLQLWQEYRPAFEPDCPATLCHMDLWIENVLVDDEGHVIALFDFDRACYGDMENEFAVAEYCGITTKSFWEGYGSQPAQTPESAVRRWFYLLYEHQKYIVIRISGRHHDCTSARRYADECRRLMRYFAQTGQPLF